MLFKGCQIIIPDALRKELIQKVHKGHLVVESYLKRAGEVFYWPLMNAEIKDYVSNCSVCNILQSSQSQEPLNTCEIPARPWNKMATDLFSLNGDNFIVLVDYYSDFIEMEHIKSMSSQSMIQALKVTFGCHGKPESLVSENGPVR